MVHGSGFRVSGFGFRVSGLGFRVQGLGFRVEGLTELREKGLGLVYVGCESGNNEVTSHPIP
eukprot:2098328-Rhodomonas_salina.1